MDPVGLDKLSVSSGDSYSELGIVLALVFHHHLELRELSLVAFRRPSMTYHVLHRGSVFVFNITASDCAALC